MASQSALRSAEVAKFGLDDNVTLLYHTDIFHSLCLPRENEVREHIPVPYDNLFQSILSSRHADKVFFSLGSMVAQAMANGHQVVRSDVPSDTL